MQTGSELIKVRPNGRLYHRLFTLDADLQQLRWHPSSKKPHKACSQYYKEIAVACLSVCVCVCVCVCDVA